MSVFRSIFFAVLVAFAGFPVQSAHAAATQEARFAAAIEATKTAMMGDPEDALKKSDAALALASQMPDTAVGGIARATAKWLRTEALIGLNRMDDAATTVAPAVALIERHGRGTKLHGDLLRSRGAVAALTGKVQPALVDYFAAHRIFRALQEKRSEAIALQDIGQIYWEAGDYDRTLRYLADANELYNADPGFALTNHNTRAETLRMMGRGKEAEAQFELALKQARALDSTLLETRILANLALVQVDNGRLVAAAANADRALTLSQSPDAADWRKLVLAVKAKVAAKRSDFAAAAALLDASFTGVNLDKTDLVYREFHDVAAQVFERVGKLARANAHLKAANRLDQQASKLISATSSQVLAAEFDFANQNLRIAQLKQGQLERDIKIERQQAEFRNRLFAGLGLAGVIVLGLTLAAYVSIRRSRNDVRAANKVLSSTNQELNHALRAKSDFLAMTSHEIRTPLNGIMGMAQVILAGNGLDARVREQMTLLNRSSQAMKALVDDLLDTAKLESGQIKLDPAPVDIAGLAQEAVALWQSQADAKGLRLALNVNLPVHRLVTDGARVRQIILNLISNAVKFTDQGGITVTMVKDAASATLVLTVTDSGVGIPADQLDKVFEDFHQVDSGTSRTYGGTGLGLAITRKLAEALGGTVNVTSSVGAGSTFVVRLPFVTDEQPVGGRAAPMHLSERRIGLVEANEMKRTIIGGLIQPRVAGVIPAATGDAARALINPPQVDMLIIEAHSIAPDEGQLNELAALLADARAADIATLILLPRDSHIDADALRALGAGQVVIKPVDGNGLVIALQSLHDDVMQNAERAGTRDAA